VEKARSKTSRKTSNRNHCGICVFFRSNFKVRNIALFPCIKHLRLCWLTVHHGGISLTVLTILTTLQKRFAVKNSALSWFQSYLAGRTQTVHLYATVSDAIHVDCGVPQGSVLGPKTFIAYVDEMHDIFEGYGLYHHAFADDTQNRSVVVRLVHCAPVAIIIRKRRCRW